MIANRFDAVLFDCDGVLVDSEPITNGLIRDMMAELGWVMTPAQCMAQFVGKAIKDELALIAEKTGQRLDQTWVNEFWRRRNLALLDQLQPVAHILQAVERVHAMYSGQIACASGADRAKVVLQLEKTGLMRFFEGRIFSGHEMPRSKPAPDVYLAAAAALGVDPKRCAVVEDTETGILAGVSAGATVFAYAPDADAYGQPSHTTPASLLKAGANRCFSSMQGLPDLLA